MNALLFLGSLKQTPEVVPPQAVMLCPVHCLPFCSHSWKLTELFDGVQGGAKNWKYDIFFLSPLQHSYLHQHCCVCEGCRLGSDVIFWQISHVALSGLRNWTAPVSPKSVMLARQFKAFLPPKNKLDLGDPWWIIPSELNIFTGYLSNNRFYPPPPKGKEVRYEIWFTFIWEVACMNAYCFRAQINWMDEAIALCLTGLSKAAGYSQEHCLLNQR